MTTSGVFRKFNVMLIDKLIIGECTLTVSIRETKITGGTTQPVFPCSKLTIVTLDQWRRSGVFIVNFEHISQRVIVLLLLFLNM